MHHDTGQSRRTTVLIIGAGPVGLFLGLALQTMRVPCLLIDRRCTFSDRSRAIGIHPPSLALFDRLGLADALLAEGCRVQAGIACSGQRVLGRMSFGGAGGKYPFILTLPQGRTETCMREALSHTEANLLTGVTLDALQASDEGVIASLINEAGERTTIAASYVVGCDGKESVVRRQAGIPFRGGQYDDRYVMGDFPDHLPEKTAAYINISAAGLVEAIPLPDGLRRWVLRLPDGGPDLSPKTFLDEIAARTGEQVPSSEDAIDHFGVQHYLADRTMHGRLLLAGDAAHVMSPIGGQGMNVGWMDAWDLAYALAGKGTLQAYDRVTRQRARMAIRRARFNMVLGRPTRMAPVRDGLVRMMLNTPLRHGWVRRFTMQDLPRLSA